MKKRPNNPLVSCVMCTYGRFSEVQRSLTFFLDQNYEHKELIIFNTAGKRLELSEELKNKNIQIINQQISTETNKPYTNIGEVRRDSIKHMKGDIYICWDDDDLFLPHHISQGVKKLIDCGKLAWKSKYSFFTGNGGDTFDMVENNMEASVLMWKEVLDVASFKDGNGDEHAPWLAYVRKNNQFVERDLITPNESYVYYWGDGLHKQSGDLGNPDNFENHKKSSVDFGNEPLNRVDVSKFYGMIGKYVNQLNEDFKIPIIINNFNRLTTTKNMVEKLQTMGYTNIYILDMNSSYVPLLQWYHQIHDQINIIRYYENHGHMALWSTGYNKNFDDWIIYTDSDIELNPQLNINFVQKLKTIAENYDMRKVGFALRIDDFRPNQYGYEYKFTDHEHRHWQDSPEPTLYRAHTDTTFAMIRAEDGHDYESIRIASDMTARHMPWYVNFDNLSKEEKYFLENSREVSTYKKHYDEFLQNKK